MHIRSITVFTSDLDDRASAAANIARNRLTALGYDVQTLRVALPSLQHLDVATAHRLEQAANDAGFSYLSVGPMAPDLAAELVTATENLFCSSTIVDAEGLIVPDSLAQAAAAMTAIGERTALGFGNLRYAALACVPPGTPFFPAAYHDAGPPSLAIAVEGASLALAAAIRHRDDKDKGEGENQPDSAHVAFSPVHHLTRTIEEHAAQIEAALAGLEMETGVTFAGCDWSLAPHPAPTRSTGAAIETLSGAPFGAWGTLAAVRALTEAIRAAVVRRVGFSGVILPVLEDATLAQRNLEGQFTLRDLLAFSTVCGTGLDTIPLPGDTTPDQIVAILSEVAALASALRKPLTARLMPIPDLRAGNITRFEFDYFVNTSVMRVA